MSKLVMTVSKSVPQNTIKGHASLRLPFPGLRAALQDGDGACGCSGLLARCLPGLGTLGRPSLFPVSQNTREEMVPGEGLAGSSPATEPLSHLCQTCLFLLGFAGCALVLTAGLVSLGCAQGTDASLLRAKLKLPWTFPLTLGLFLPHLMPLGILFGHSHGGEEGCLPVRSNYGPAPT